MHMYMYILLTSKFFSTDTEKGKAYTNNFFPRRQFHKGETENWNMEAFINNHFSFFL